MKQRESTNHLLRAIKRNRRDYAIISEIIKNHVFDWDAYLDVRKKSENGDYCNVFSAWIDCAKLELSKYTHIGGIQRDVLRKIKSDVVWWMENKGSPVGRKNIDIIDVLLNDNLYQTKKFNPGLYKKWSLIWSAAGWIEGGIPQKDILSSIKNINCEEDLYIAAHAKKSWEKVRGENGENVLHMIAQYEPVFLEKFISKMGGTALLHSPDSRGRYPIEYFLCFSENFTIIRAKDYLLELLKYGKSPKADWLEVKTLVAENNTTYSGVDSVPMQVWKQETPEDFKSCLKSDRGKKLIKMVGSDFTYSKYKSPTYSYHSGVLVSTHDEVYCGMNINEYTVYGSKYYTDNSKSTRESIKKFSGSPAKNSGGFFDSAETEDEVRISLMQSWREFYIYSKHTSTDDYIQKKIKTSYNLINILVDRAIELGIDVAEMKNEAIESFPPNKTDLVFDRFMGEKFKNWWYLLNLVEKRKLMDMFDIGNQEKRIDCSSVL